MIADPLIAAVAGSTASGLATALGAIPVLALERPSAVQENLLLGFAAGVMTVASFFSLVVPGIALAEAQGNVPWIAALIVAASVCAGAAALHAMGRRLQTLSARWQPRTAPGNGTSQAAAMMILAITLHNLPEGAAVGVGFAGGDLNAGLSTALAIGIQNIPEGLAVAGGFTTLGYGRRAAFAGALASGLVEPVAGTFSALAVGSALILLPFAYGAAAGAMIHIVVDQIVPDGRARVGGAGLLRGFFAGFALMLILDTALG